jgi:limonene-1,2-epoxide hydrolase
MKGSRFTDEQIAKISAWRDYFDLNQFTSRMR